MFGYPENRDSTVATLRRARVDKIDDDGAQQIMKKLRGLKSEAPEDVYRAQSHGFSSHPPKGSEGLFLSLGGRADRIVGLGFEHKDKRPKKLPEGGSIQYDADGNMVRVVKDDLQIAHSKKFSLKVGQGFDNGSNSDAAGGKSISIVATKDKIVVTFDDTSVTLESGKATVKSPKVIVDSADINLGGEGGALIGLCGGGCATRVKAI